MAVAKRNVADKKRRPAGKVKVEVRIGALYHDDRSWPTGAILEVSAADAKVLRARGEVGKPGSLRAEAEQARAEAEQAQVEVEQEAEPSTDQGESATPSESPPLDRFGKGQERGGDT